MPRLTKSLNAWQTPRFDEILKGEIRQMDTSILPLQQGLAHGSVALDDVLDVIIISKSEGMVAIHVKTGIFYAGIIAGSCCADDPTPVDKTSEYCEVLFDIDRITAVTAISLLPG